jgi:Pectinacetylesterase
VIVLEGGGLCAKGTNNPTLSCKDRKQELITGFAASEDKTSKDPKKDGILSNTQGNGDYQNPFSASFDKVYLNYCSSDSWTGRSGKVAITWGLPSTASAFAPCGPTSTSDLGGYHVQSHKPDWNTNTIPLANGKSLPEVYQAFWDGNPTVAVESGCVVLQ